MSTFSLRLPALAASLVAVMAISGCNSTDTTYDSNNSKFDQNSDLMSKSVWNVPTNTVNSYDYVATSTTTPATGPAVTVTDPTSYFYQSYRKVSAAGDNEQAIGAVQMNLSVDFSPSIQSPTSLAQYALGRDGAVYVLEGVQNNYQDIATRSGPPQSNWEVQFPATMNLNDTWAVSSDGVPVVGFTYTYTYTDNIIPAAPVQVQDWDTTETNAVTVAKVVDINATSGSYTGLTKIVYTTTYRARNYPANAVFIGRDLFSYSKTLYWKPGTGVILEEQLETSAEIDVTAPPVVLLSAPRAVFVAPTVQSTTTTTSARTLTAAGTPATNG